MSVRLCLSLCFCPRPRILPYGGRDHEYQDDPPKLEGLGLSSETSQLTKPSLYLVVFMNGTYVWYENLRKTATTTNH